MARKSKYTPDQRAALRKARQKKQEKYWEDRAQSRVLATDRQVDDIRIGIPVVVIHDVLRSAGSGPVPLRLPAGPFP